MLRDGTTSRSDHMMEHTERRDANTAWFAFSSEAEGGFGVYAFDGTEEAHKPFLFFIELVHKSDSLNIAALLGTKGCLAITDAGGGTRYVHGHVKSMRQLHTANSFTHYSCVLVPRVDFLEKRINHRIFQNLSVVQIISRVLAEQGFSDTDFALKLNKDYEPREYCVQYGESDLHFLSRLCEEEGIFYYFEHSQGNHCLCFSDWAGGPKIAGEYDLRFFPGSGTRPDTSVIHSLAYKVKTTSNAAAYSDWNFTKPNLDLLMADAESSMEKAPVPGGMKLEKYAYPHIYALRGAGASYTSIQLERQMALARQISVESDVSRFVPGHTFTINSHPREDVNSEWWIVSTSHKGEQPGILEHEAPSGRGFKYDANATAIPASTRFVPENLHLKRKAQGKQTAIVTAPEGEEIYTDKYGRVKVKFIWDRSDAHDETSSCWIRVSQGWAGNKYGSMVIPRAGHEVLVSFLEGDPDRPLITGRGVYNGLNMPPYELPEHKTKTYFRSMTTPGEPNEPRGFNEIRVEDKAGEEEIFIHAERDYDSHIKNDWSAQIQHQQHLTVDNDVFVHVKQEDHHIGHKDRKVELHADQHTTISGDLHLKVDKRLLTRGLMEIHYQSPRIILEAGSELTLKGGSAFVRMTPVGAKGVGKRVDLDSGTSSGGSNAATPEEPIMPIETKPTAMPDLPWRGRGNGNN